MFSPPNMFAGSQEVTFRPAKITDAFRLADIHVACWNRAYKKLFPPRIQKEISNAGPVERIATWRKIVQENKQPLHLTVLNNRVVGFFRIGAADATASTGEIQSLYIQPEYWRQGIGAIVCEHALNDLQTQGFTRAVVWCLKDYPPACRLYESRCGMVVDNEDVRCYYRFPKLVVRYHRELA